MRASAIAHHLRAPRSRALLVGRGPLRLRQHRRLSSSTTAALKEHDAPKGSDQTSHETTKAWRTGRQHSDAPPSIPHHDASERHRHGWTSVPNRIVDLLDLEIEPGRDKDVIVHGYVRSSRKHKTVDFLDVADGSTTEPLQVVLPKDMAARWEE
jgi:hypothetical protein